MEGIMGEEEPYPMIDELMKIEKIWYSDYLYYLTRKQKEVCYMT